MAAEQIKSITTLPIADITVEHRLRDVGEAGVEAIMSSIRELGVLKDPIHVRKVPHRGNKLVLIAGGHRLEAARRLGWEEIPATVWTCSDDWARLMEVDDNLASAELTALDTAVFLAERKRLYEALHPETKAGLAGALHKNHATDIMSVAQFSCFAQATAEKFGMTDRHVRRLVAAGGKLDPHETRLLRLAPRPVTLADLQVIGAIETSGERYAVIEKLATGSAKSAAVARKLYKAETGNAPPPQDPTDVAFNALRNSFERAPKAARRRFVDHHLDELLDLVMDADRGRLEARVIELKRLIGADDTGEPEVVPFVRRGDSA